ncbi:MAG TPA: transglutaminase domain-containing protein [Anaerovoracaceae bacterium]|nr:transglutaminase domain-containing protein [Anaerovoracaceae bacterium]
MNKPELKKIDWKKLNPKNIIVKLKEMDKKKLLIGGAVTVQVLLVAGLIAVIIQNSNIAAQFKEYIASEGEIHEIYDDTAVVKAYKTGDDKGLNAEDKYVLKTATQIIKDNIKDDMTDYEKEKAIYDWQVAYTAYSETSLAPINVGDQYSHTPYGVLKYKQAICVGNATTFKLFMDMLGIETKIIHSTQEGEHAWDVVKLDNEWYHVDVTFDGGNSGNPGYNYFNVPDSVKDNGSYPWDHSEIPACDGTKYCYILNNASVIDDIYGLPELIKKGMDEKKGTIAFMIKDTKGFNGETLEYVCSAFNTGMSYVYYNNALAIGGKTLYTISISNESDTPSDVDNGEITMKLQEIIDKLLNGGGDMSYDGGFDNTDDGIDDYSDRDGDGVKDVIGEG